MSTRKSLAPGDTVKTHCTSCAQARDHKVIVLVNDQTFHIECTSCDRGQEYQPPASKPRAAKKTAATTAAKPPRGKADPAIAEQKEWALLRPDMNIDKAVAYDMANRYQTKSVLLHSAFGLGLVTRVAGPHKVEVLFETGKKILRCQ